MNKTKEITLFAFASEMLTSIRRQGFENAHIDEQLMERIKEIANSDINLEDPIEFEKIKEEIENYLKRS